MGMTTTNGTREGYVRTCKLCGQQVGAEGPNRLGYYKFHCVNCQSIESLLGNEL